MAISRYWLTDKNAPFATVLNFLDAYYHPEVHDDNFHRLVQRAALARDDDIELADFKRGLVQLLLGEREGLHPKALSTAAAYDQSSDDEFLKWLWHELYPSEPLPESA
jgi:hypothetical protein